MEILLGILIAILAVMGSALTAEDVMETIHYLQAKGVKRVGLSAHDSCNWTLNAFEEAWGEAFQVVTVGQPLEFSGNGDKL